VRTRERFAEFAGHIGEEDAKVEQRLLERFRRELELVQAAVRLELQEARAEFERRLGVLQTAHDADMRALREELEQGRQPERKRLPAARHNGRAGVQ
jgi:hypothetical protein